MSYRDKRILQKNQNVMNRETNLASTVDNLTKQLQLGSSDTNQPSESAQAIQELNKDVKDGDGFSTIDQNTDLSHNQIVLLSKLEGLSRINFFTAETGRSADDGVEKLTRTFQRKQVSKNRKGRSESIEMFQMIDNKKEGRGFWERWFSPKE